MTRATNVKIAGFAFLFYIVVGVTQLVLEGGAGDAEGTAAKLARIAEHSSDMRISVVLTLVTTFTAFALAVALYGITRDEDRELAVFGLACRVGEGMLGAIAILTTLGLLWLGTAGAGTEAPATAATYTLGAFLLKLGGWNTTIAATLFAVGSTCFSWLLLRGRMIPVPLAWLGVVASILLVVGLPLRLVDVVHGPITQLMWLPMAAYEIPLGLWLLIKGVATPATR